MKNPTVMLIDESPARGAMVEQALKDAGYLVVARLSVDDDILMTMDRVHPDLVIIDMESPDRDSLENMRHISRHQPRPIVLFTEKSDGGTIEKAIKAGVSAYVVDGFNDKQIKPIMDVAIARFREFQALRNELEETKTKLEDRKNVDKAKGLLMKQHGMNEEQAYHALRKLAMDQNITMGAAAVNVISVSRILG